FDLDQQNQYRQQFAVLTEESLYVLGGDAGVAATNTHAIPLPRIYEARIVEGLGVDRLQINSDEKLACEMRYTRRHRRDMTRLQRKIDRRRPRKEGETELAPEWLEVR